jgi:hypothetical protein
MALITPVKCNQFIADLHQGVHNFETAGGHTFKVALFATAAALSASTTAYSSSNEASGGGYAAGGYAVTFTTASQTGGTFTLSASNVVFTAASTNITFEYALLYNATASGKNAVYVLDYGSALTLTPGDSITISWPSNLWTAA